jgi:hypothetical protein
MAIEDLAVLTEATARMLHEGKWNFTTDAMLGGMLNRGTPLYQEGFSLNRLLDVKVERAARQVITDARSGDRSAIGRVTQTFRNLSAHSTDLPGWILDRAFLMDVAQVQLDFITTVASIFEKQHGKLPDLTSTVGSNPAASGPTMAPSPSEILTEMSGGVGRTP